MTDETKLPLTTPNPADDLLAQLREAAPQIFSEGKIDLDKLKAALGEHIEPRIERYGLNWAGKSDAFRNVQQPSVGTLLPMPDASVDWDSTENLIIEGDNLEVLKLLQKPYHGKVKMIYIDPPYNTGNEFIYPDNFREGLDDYLRYSGQVSEEGVKQSTNTETSGRFHSKWLNMMYPRLFLARNLLRDDGVIFVSIDDNEVHNLRMLMNEVFGEECFLAKITIQSNPRGRQSERFFALVHEYLLVFAKNVDECRMTGQSLTPEQLAEFKYSDSNGQKHRLLGLRQRGAASRQIDRPEMHFPIFVNPLNSTISLYEDEHHTTKVIPKKSNGENGRWMWGKAKVLRDIGLLEARIVSGRGEWDIFVRDYLERGDGEERTRKSKTIWDEREINYQNGSTELKELFGGDSPMSYPKPVALLRKIISAADDPNGIILDFFSGSGTTAHGVLELNKDDGGNRKFILVQLPEKTDNPQYPTIADITRERVRRVIAKLNQADEGQLNLAGNAKPDRGFRAFKLSSSNFKIWDAAQASTEPEQLALQLQHYTDNVDDSRSQQDILYPESVVVKVETLPMVIRHEFSA